MSKDTKFLRQVRTDEGKIKLVRANEKRNPGRDFIFRVLFPGVFAVMTFYRIFVVQPESGEFYAKLVTKAMVRMYQSHGTEIPVNRQSASNTVQRSSTDRALLGSII